MKSALIIILLLTTVISGNAQTAIKKADITGKWEVKSLSVNTLYHDFEKDSTFIPEEVKKSFKDAEDSAKTITMMSFLFEVMKGTVFIFGSNNEYTEINGGRKAKTGTYILNENSGNISTVINTSKQEYAAILKEGILTLTVLKDDKKMTFDLKKQ